MSNTTLTTSRDPKGRRFMDNVGTAYDKAGLDARRAQLLNESPEFIPGLCELIERCSTLIEYANEEVSSSYGYLSGYRAPVAIPDQIDILRSHWPGLNPDPALRYMREEYPKLKFPSWIEGPFAMVRPGFFSNVYGEELEEVFKALAKNRQGKFQNYRQGCLGAQYLQQSQRTIEHLAMLMQQQPNSDLLIVPAQFGLRHRGRSVRRARVVIGNTCGEYGQGAKDTGIMLLTNPVRLQLLNDLWLDCVGDEYSGGGDGRFGSAPCFRFSDGCLEFDACWVSVVYGYFGSVSAFLSQ